MSDEDLVCFCLHVSRSEIRKAIEEGIDTVEDLKTTLGCCTGCGTCEGRVLLLIDEVKNKTKGIESQPDVAIKQKEGGKTG